MSYSPTNNIRIVTAASLFDGHDAAINIMRRIMQSKGAEVIHLGHNRSVAEIVECAIEEDAQGIAITSYQGGHVEFFKYMKDLLTENGCGHIKIFGGGGGTILPSEIDELHKYGITRIYSPDDGRHMGLEGMIEDVVKQCSPLLTPTAPSKSPPMGETLKVSGNSNGHYALGEYRDIIKIAKSITLAENGQPYKHLNGNSHEYFATADPFYYKTLKEFALEHRKNFTEAEGALWNYLRDKQLEGIKFRRQHIIEKFIADFISLDKHLIIEVDGLIHQMPDVKLNDEQRTERLNELGFKVIRINNESILHDIDNTLTKIKEAAKVSPMGGDLEGAVLGITGTGGAGKSSVTDEIVRRFLNTYPDKTIAVISVDPSKKKTGGALLGDRIRMNSIHSPRAYMRSLATRESDKALSEYVQEAIDICKEAKYDFIILESAGVGQSDASILDYCDVSMYVMTPEYGAASQLEKINMLDYADIVCINKFDKAGALDALHDVKKQYKRNNNLWTAKDNELPVVGTIASQFNDAGVNELFERLMETVATKTGVKFAGDIEHHKHTKDTTTQTHIIPAKLVRYLAEIAEEIYKYNKLTDEQAEIASKLYKLKGAQQILKDVSEVPSTGGDLPTGQAGLGEAVLALEKQLFPLSQKLLDEWEETKSSYQKEFFEYNVRGKIIKL
ncbi:MAG: methylmalonyl-CoA mutase family protein, partial [Chitinophagaceae bacterium]|nr:methylmalonyl-CoA mutase family protein [Chitinophagaceae bacterium]